ncbi:MAG: alanine--glyoxylate aminotransferase family protein [Hyphomicrobiales bacterium]|nr:alanine--glyoxylate aminotransferase family protein [Hyphomicrobiales bacterium]
MNRNVTDPFLPPQRLLLGPGPSPVAPEVLAALALPTIGHLDPSFIGLMDELKQMLQTLFNTKNDATFTVAGPGSVGMDACILNMVEAGDKILIARNGVFGMRMTEVAARGGADVITLDFEWGTPVDPAAVDDALSKDKDIKFLAFVHAETSTGVLSDGKAIGDVAKKHGVMVIMDTVTSAGGVPVMVDDWGVDAVYTGTQKCLSAPPGLSPVSFSPRALEHIKNRKTKVLSWFLDVTQVMAYWGGEGARAYHHTAPINALYGLHEALRRLLVEGLDNSFARHRKAHEYLVAGLEKRGMEMLVAPPFRLPQLNTVKIPAGADDAKVRRELLLTHNIEIGAGLGPLAGKVWRIGLMGEGARDEHVDTLLSALDKVLAS